MKLMNFLKRRPRVQENLKYKGFPIVAIDAWSADCGAQSMVIVYVVSRLKSPEGPSIEAFKVDRAEFEREYGKIADPRE